MDRRGFFKTFFFTSLFTPILLSSKSKKFDLQLYLIADYPQMFLSPLLHELKICGLINGHKFTLFNLNPQSEDLKRILYQNNWKWAEDPYQADFSLAFRRLGQYAPPSFTLVKEGNILDMRLKTLSLLWEEMNKRHSPSSLLTIVSFKSPQTHMLAGRSASIYVDGSRAQSLSLNKKTSKSFQTKRGGKISVRVENGKAWISYSSCRQQICCFSPPVFLDRERIICAPNHFLLEINSSSIDTAIG